jgi:hypothetical protein
MTTISTKSHLRIPHLLKGSTVYLQRASRPGFFAITSFPRYSSFPRPRVIRWHLRAGLNMFRAPLLLPSDLPARGRLRYSQRTNTHCITQSTILLPSAPSPRPRAQLSRIPAHHPFLHHCASLDGAHDGSGIAPLPARVLACPSS